MGAASWNCGTWGIPSAGARALLESVLEALSGSAAGLARWYAPLLGRCSSRGPGTWSVILLRARSSPGPQQDAPHAEIGDGPTANVPQAVGHLDPTEARWRRKSAGVCEIALSVREGHTASGSAPRTQGSPSVVGSAAVGGNQRTHHRRGWGLTHEMRRPVLAAGSRVMVRPHRAWQHIMPRAPQVRGELFPGSRATASATEVKRRGVLVAGSPRTSVSICSEHATYTATCSSRRDRDRIHFCLDRTGCRRRDRGTDRS